MSAQPIEKSAAAGLDPTAGDPDTHHDGTVPERGPAPEPVEVRHRAAVSLLLGVLTAAMAIAYLWRAVSSAAALDWLVFAVLALLTAGLFRTLLDARLPLLVADELGVRFRLGTQWRGLPWEAVDRLEVTPRRGLLRDGRLVVTLHHMHRAIEGVDGRARRHARLNQRMYGAVLAVPLGLTTRISQATPDTLQQRLVELSQGRADVVSLLPEREPVPTSRRPEHDETVSETVPAAAGAAPEAPLERSVISVDEPPAPDRRPRWRRRGTDETPDTAPDQLTDDVTVDDEPAADVRPLDPTRGASPAAPVVPAQASSKVRAIARLGEPVAPLVIEEFEPHPAYDPVIGPELAAARTRVGLSVDELADRTRIRPHVIESIEVDDFTPCGGDFYARGHIRTLARSLGKDPAPMLAQFDERYATAPISPRRVFEAELATGLTGSMRSTSAGGPTWLLLVAAVLVLVLVWSAVRLFSVDGETQFETPPPVLNGSAGLGNGFGGSDAPAAVPTVATTLTAVQAGASVEVRDGEGELVFEGDLVIGEVRTVEAQPPVTVSTDNGGALSVTVGGVDQGFLGELDEPATAVFQRPER